MHFLCGFFHEIHRNENAIQEDKIGSIISQNKYTEYVGIVVVKIK
jgi:hypothetical protein